MTKVKYLVAIILIIVSLKYCFRFGYIWTAYAHGGQLLGIPFVIILIFFFVQYFLNVDKIRKDKWYYAGLILFLTCGLFSITIELIRSYYSHYFEFLYYDDIGWVDKILLGWILLGLTSYIWIYIKINKQKIGINKHST